MFSLKRGALAVVVMVVLAACTGPDRGDLANGPPRSGRFDEGLIWRLDHPGLPTAYIVGTQHVDGWGVAPVVQTASMLMSEVDIVALEVDLDPPEDISPFVWQHFSSSAPPFLDQELTPGLWDILVRQGAGIGVPAQRLRLLSPTGAAFIFSNELSSNRPRPEDRGVDIRLGEIAQLREIPVVGLETHEEALNSLFRIGDWVDRWVDPDAVISGAILQAVLGGKVGPWTPRRQQSAASAAYDREDIAYFVSAATDSERFSTPAARDLQRVTQGHLIVDRNHRFIDRMLALINDGPVLVAVGAAHLPGPEGMLELLAAQGFEIARIPLSR